VGSGCEIINLIITSDLVSKLANSPFSLLSAGLSTQQIFFRHGTRLVCVFQSSNHKYNCQVITSVGGYLPKFEGKRSRIEEVIACVEILGLSRYKHINIPIKNSKIYLSCLSKLKLYCLNRK
jgi:hypothetical protein